MGIGEQSEKFLFFSKTDKFSEDFYLEKPSIFSQSWTSDVDFSFFSVDRFLIKIGLEKLILPIIQKLKNQFIGINQSESFKAVEI